MFEEELFLASPDIEISEEEQRIYQKIVGSIFFVIISTRSDIAFAAFLLREKGGARSLCVHPIKFVRLIN